MRIGLSVNTLQGGENQAELDGIGVYMSNSNSWFQFVIDRCNGQSHRFNGLTSNILVGRLRLVD